MSFHYFPRKIGLILAIASLLPPAMRAQYPQIRWWFDTRDASFGQTAAADTDHDGHLELVFGCYRNDSSVYALNAEDGSLLWKYNTAAPGVEGCNDVAPVIFDVNNDDTLEVIVPASCNPRTFCFNGHTGKVKWQRATRGSDSPPSIADLDGDGTPEILHGEFGGYVICLNGESGTVQWEIAVDLNSWIQTAPSIADLDGDAKPDFVVATWNTVSGDTNKIFAFRGYDHHLLWTYPLQDVVYHGTAIADLDSDGKPELLLGDYSGKLYALNGEDGSLAWEYQWADGYYIGAPVTITDLDNDGPCEVLLVSWFKVIALRSGGSIYWHYSIPDYGTAFRGTVTADINGDGLPEVLFGTSEGRFIALNGQNGMVVLNIDLSVHYGKAFDIDHAPVVADFEGDGVLDAFLVGGHAEYPNFENDYGRGYAMAVGDGNGPDWLMFQQDIQRTGSTCGDTLTAIPVNPDDDQPDIRAYPNPFYSEVTFYGNLNGNIRICDFSGRLVKEVPVPLDQTKGEVTWDGEDAGGKKVAAGVYYAVISGLEGKDIIKLVLK